MNKNVISESPPVENHCSKWILCVINSVYLRSVTQSCTEENSQTPNKFI